MYLLFCSKSGQSIEAKNIVIATGVIPRTGGLIANDNVLIGPGMHIDNYDFKDKRVAILGGGDNAAENYGFVKKTSPKKINLFAHTLIARRCLSKKYSRELQ